MKKALIGYGGHAREVMSQMGEKIPCFVEDEFYFPQNNVFPLSEFNHNEYEVMVAISDTNVRKKIVDRLPIDTKFFTFIHPNSLIGENVIIGDGSFIGAYSILTIDIKIGNHSILNRFNQIGDDSFIGDYFSMMPGAIISGNVKIGDKVYLGTNSSVKEKITITDDVIIGLNSGVVKDITEMGTYVGVPVKKIK